jgi:hypothetical protein
MDQVASGETPLTKFLEGLSSLTWEAFEFFVADVLRSTGRFSDIVHHARLGSRHVDILATEAKPITAHSRRWAFEVKSHKLISIDVVDAVVGMKLSLQTEDPYINLVLVVSGNLTARARQRAESMGIEVWEGLTLASMTPQEVIDRYFCGSIQSPDITLYRDNKANSLIESLSTIKPGREAWSEFQRLSSDILEYLFCPPLEPPRYEFSDTDSRNRRDMILENSTRHDFWSHIRSTYAAHYIVADAKNYGAPLKKQPVLDLAHYLKPYGCGLFGILLSRKGAGLSASHAVREQWIGGNKMIVVLSDYELKEMIRIKSTGGKPEEIIRKVIADFRMSL